MIEIGVIAGLSVFVLLLQFYNGLRSQILFDRLSDKLLAVCNQQAFITYSNLTPTKEDMADANKFPSKNGKGNGKPLEFDDAFSNLPTHLSI